MALRLAQGSIGRINPVAGRGSDIARWRQQPRHAQRREWLLDRRHWLGSCLDRWLFRLSAAGEKQPSRRAAGKQNRGAAKAGHGAHPCSGRIHRGWGGDFDPRSPRAAVTQVKSSAQPPWSQSNCRGQDQGWQIRLQFPHSRNNANGGQSLQTVQTAQQVLPAGDLGREAIFVGSARFTPNARPGLPALDLRGLGLLFPRGCARIPVMAGCFTARPPGRYLPRESRPVGSKVL